ncbi:UNVERIFIED_CONTAM: putative sugar phosphate/phosphate translocator [Sesamum radiatum]|uniref:Sugar phosphate/phosphate translocator n=1 Tax=Sesamum radiatum TaxID=300843 RepID=A0AAW2K3Y5_SESRA
MANPNRKWLRQEFATYTYILLYIALSSGQIFFNKIMKVEQGMTPDIKDELWMYGCISSVVLIGAMFAMTMAREHRLPPHICCLCSNVESNHWTRSDELQDASDNVGDQFRYRALCLLIPWIFLERLKMDAQGTWSFKPLMLMLTSLCTFALNLSVCLVISHTSALTIRVAGVVKDWVVVLLSALLFADTNLTLINLLGYAIGEYLFACKLKSLSRKSGYLHFTLHNAADELLESSLPSALEDRTQFLEEFLSRFFEQSQGLEKLR